MSRSLVPALRCHSAMEAQIAGARLEAAGLGVHVQASVLPGTVGLLSPSVVWVPEDQLREAQLVLGLLREEDGRLTLLEISEGAGKLSLVSEEVGALSLERCPRCEAPWETGFEVCWRCDCVPDLGEGT